MQVIATSPTGRFVLRTAPWEARMSHWVSPPALYDDEHHTLLFTVTDTHWSVDQAEWLSDTLLRLALSKYPGSEGMCAQVTIDCTARTARVGERDVPLPELEATLEQAIGPQAAQARYTTAPSPLPTPAKGRRWIYLALALALVLLVAWIAAAPWFTMQRIAAAAQARDAQALAEHVDFESVRQSLKAQLNATVLRKMGGESKQALNPLAALVAPLAGAVVDTMVDAAITPEGVLNLMAGVRPTAQPGGGDDNGGPPRERRTPPDALGQKSMGYRSVNRFVVTMHGRQGDTQFVLARRGLGWKLVEIILPPS